ncbi:NAD+ synthase [Pseudovibrio axinellae]|nr:NAD+ synthase [Pseudovibrio axinellae]
MIKDQFRLAVVQANPCLGDVSGNAEKVRHHRKLAAEEGADLVLFTELFLSGYAPEDLVLKPSFVAACKRELESLAQETADGGPALLVGLPWAEGGKLYNAVALLDSGRIEGLRYKVDLPNYSVFDEKRVFNSGPNPGPMNFRGVRIGVPICEDTWTDEVCECLAETGAEILLVPNGSPYNRGKTEERMQIMLSRIVETGLPLVYCNQTGGQDEVVYDGASFALNHDHSLVMQLSQFQEDIGYLDWQKNADQNWVAQKSRIMPLPQTQEADWLACVLGLKDYVNKNGFPGVVLGLSGGIDSAICAAIAVDALGADRVHCIMLPYRYTSEASIADAKACADALGVKYDTIPIAEPVEGFQKTLADVFAGTKSGVTEENLQSRSRGVILMAVSNKFGAMVVTTGNKSEMSVGYATLYGDMNGGFNPIKDLYKTEVYRLSDWRNKHHPFGVLGPSGEVIPNNIIVKAPTAELRENQTDQDSLPEYDVLDDILHCLVEEEMSLDEIEKRGHSAETIHRIEHLLYIAEYKRRQAAPGVKITLKNFGRDRRYPITNRFRDRS